MESRPSGSSAMDARNRKWPNSNIRVLPLQLWRLCFSPKEILKTSAYGYQELARHGKAASLHHQAALNNTIAFLSGSPKAEQIAKRLDL
jgi:hypothetical protein